MKKTVWTFGLLAGGVLAGMMFITLPFEERIGYDKAEIVGYTTMVLAFLLVFFGIRSYRENVGGGSVSFGRALAIGALITVVSSLCYVAAWEVIYYKLSPDFIERYQAHAIDKARQGGASQAAIDKQIEEMRRFAELYKNPFFNAAMTFLEPLPVGLVITLVSAGILRRRRREEFPPLRTAGSMTSTQGSA